MVGVYSVEIGVYDLGLGKDTIQYVAVNGYEVRSGTAHKYSVSYRSKDASKAAKIYKFDG